MNLIKETKSLCPECLKVLPATIYEEGGRVYIKKRCPEHGEWTGLYWGDYEQYMRVLKYEHLAGSWTIHEPRRSLDAPMTAASVRSITHTPFWASSMSQINVSFGMLRRFLLPIIWRGDYESLGDFHHRLIMVGTMHFMDPYNFDLERVNRCVINYAVPDGRIVPFCTMNTLHRRAVEKEFAKPLEESKITPLYDVESLRKRILREMKA